MRRLTGTNHRWRLAAALALAAVSSAALALSAGAAQQNAYAVHNLVSDQSGVADHQDTNLVNAWGLAALRAGPWWVADNGSDASTLYRPDGSGFPPGMPLVVHVPTAPTGLVANDGSSFLLNGAPALFLFATEEGKILAWNQSVGTEAAVVASGTDAIYKGLAIASTSSGDRLYAADFHNAAVDVFDGNFNPVDMPGAFVDPKLPAGYAPFGIQNVNGRIFVSYAKQDDQKEDEVAGQGRGFVDVFDTDGRLLSRVASHGQLDAPWGIALAPADFGRFGGDLLVGNFGDGQINAYRPAGGGYEHAGELRTSNGEQLRIDGLWALQFGHGAQNNGPGNTLFFTAGPDDESHGLFGTITAQ